MSDPAPPHRRDERESFIVDTLVDAFSDLMSADPDAFRTKFRKMAADPFVVSEISPYEADLDWSELTEPDELAEVIEQLGQAVAKVHCVSDADSDQSLVDFQTEDAIVTVIGDHEDEFVADMVDFGLGYAATVRDDHRHFVEAFREGRIPGVTAT